MRKTILDFTITDIFGSKFTHYHNRRRTLLSQIWNNSIFSGSSMLIDLNDPSPLKWGPPFQKLCVFLFNFAIFNFFLIWRSNSAAKITPIISFLSIFYCIWTNPPLLIHFWFIFGKLNKHTIILFILIVAALVSISYESKI